MTTGTVDGQPPATGTYPVRLQVGRPEKQSRLTNFPVGIGTFIRYILLIPQIVVLYFVGLVALVLYLVATFAILFSGRYPQGMFDFVAGYLRWSNNVSGYIFSLYDEYPPFSTDDEGYPLTLEVDYPATSSRLLNFPLIGMFIKEIILIPSFIALAFLGIVAFVVIFIAKFAILFTGSFPEGMHRFVTGTVRWSARVNAYVFGLTDRYPPFSMD